MPERTTDWGCEHGRHLQKASAEVQMNKMEICVMAACSSADGAGSGGSEALCEPAEAVFEGGTLSSGKACGGDKIEVSPGGTLKLAVQNVMSCVTQSINGLYQHSHKYPRTMDTELSNKVKRKRMGCEPHRAGR